MASTEPLPPKKKVQFKDHLIARAFEAKVREYVDKNGVVKLVTRQEGLIVTIDDPSTRNSSRPKCLTGQVQFGDLDIKDDKLCLRAVLQYDDLAPVAPVAPVVLHYTLELKVEVTKVVQEEAEGCF